jgi:hypothetical protein
MEERLLPDLRKGRPIRDGRIEEQIQHLLSFFLY